MGSCAQTVSMKASVFLATVLAGLALAQQESLLQKHNLPELFSYDHGSHSVAVYRGAALKAAIAVGLVKGFPGLGAGRGGAGDADRSGRQFVAPTYQTQNLTDTKLLFNAKTSRGAFSLETEWPALLKTPAGVETLPDTWAASKSQNCFYNYLL